MAWNEPGGGKKDPWKDQEGQGADVEAFLNRLKNSMGRVFGGGGGGSAGREGRGGPNLWLIIGGLLAIWFVLDAWVMIDERQRGVVLRFGKFERIMDPGPNFKLPRPLESVTKVDVTQLRSVTDQVRMLTADENIVQIEFNVQYLVNDPQAYLFGAREPDATLKQAAESAVRDVIGSSLMDSVLTGERAALAADARKRLQASLDSYKTGLSVSVFNMQNARPPSEVREAFDDAISAREDRERIESEAEAYASKVVPEARGEAARIRAEAEGYKETSIARAEGDTRRFTLLADEYAKAPEVTRQRLYLETMQDILGRNRKVYAGDGGNVLYLPMDGGGAGNAPMSRLPAANTALPSMTVSAPSAERDTRRPERGSRGEPRR
ncbi:FtsH protease activity modulator HflK [Pseudomarimonas arenosa]|uniref:Protein HflK n=1 Tax=Pseudomarimonas arenosa TaxID=2774145 RepID=A0AAW3ZM63_9GAMM|nr:FtsH protease activity modulator HflK [Pseudomarimonas arenosa]MBD8527238.1 FtsH protease activity modulator HflK [Pseudomarimonas arenosa]